MPGTRAHHLGLSFNAESIFGVKGTGKFISLATLVRLNLKTALTTLTCRLVIWWSSTALIGLYIAVKGLAVLRWQRGFKDYNNVTFKRFDYEVGMSILGWAFHYFPFYLMARQLFLHHYLPALYFAIMALCQIFDFVSYRFTIFGFNQYPAIGRAAAAGFLAVAITVFTIYAPLAYGNAWTRDSCNSVKLFNSWDWDCNNFLTSVSGDFSRSAYFMANSL